LIDYYTSFMRAWNIAIFPQTQIEAEGGQCRQWAECRKLGTMVFVQPATGEPCMRFDEQDASATSVGLEWCVRTAAFQ